VRVVLDTNVLLSGAFTSGLCSRLIDELVGDREWQIVLSEHLLAEFRRHGAGTFKASVDEVEAFLAPVLEWGLMVTPEAVAPDVCRDPNDLAILGTALAGKADVLVSGDKDLLVLGSFRGIAMVTPREFYDHYIGA